MQKITFLVSVILYFSMDAATSSFSIIETEKKFDRSSIVKYWPKSSPLKIQDKNLIKGNWQRDDAAAELHISKLYKNGGLEVKYLNSKFIFVEKAGWTNSSDVLRLFVIYREENKAGYSLALNYIAEKDLLVGVYVDGLDNQSFNVTFKRIK